MLLLSIEKSIQFIWYRFWIRFYWIAIKFEAKTTQNDLFIFNRSSRATKVAVGRATENISHNLISFKLSSFLGENCSSNGNPNEHIIYDVKWFKLICEQKKKRQKTLSFCNSRNKSQLNVVFFCVKLLGETVFWNRFIAIIA